MSKNKPNFYAVLRGRKPGIYTTWAECKEQVNGFKNSLYKGFVNLEEAERYLQGEPTGQPKEVLMEAPMEDRSNTKGRNGKHFDIYTDGSYESGKYSWAFVVYQGDKLIYSGSGLGSWPWAAESHNVAGEVEAAMEAIQWAYWQKATSMTIYHDYSGVSEWALGRWKANKKISRDYVFFVSAYLPMLSFVKVKGHSGIEGNELADRLAGEVLKQSLAKKRKTKKSKTTKEVSNELIRD